jgi:hypothetical protein
MSCKEISLEESPQLNYDDVNKCERTGNVNLQYMYAAFYEACFLHGPFTFSVKWLTFVQHRLDTWASMPPAYQRHPPTSATSLRVSPAYQRHPPASATSLPVY